MRCRWISLGTFAVVLLWSTPVATSARAEVQATGCREIEPRFPVVVDVPVAPSESGSSLTVEASSSADGRPLPVDIEVIRRVERAGRTIATISWGARSKVRRMSIGTYEIVVSSSSGRSSTCVTVTPPHTKKNVERPQDTEPESIEVISIGRQSQRGGWE